jgi:cytochrome c oxidase subunit IV
MEKNTNTNYSNEYYKIKSKEQMKHQVIIFALMIIFTIVAFAMVVSEFDKVFTIPVLLLLAFVQFMFQLYYFMHMSEKGHEMPALMIYGGVFAAVLTIIGLTTITWI